MTLREWLATERERVDTFECSGILVPFADPPMLRRNLSTTELRSIHSGHEVPEVRQMARDLLAERGLTP